MEHAVYITVGVSGGCVDNIEATLDPAVAEATYRQFCEEYGYDPEHAESCPNDIGKIIVRFRTGDHRPQREVEVYELDE